MSSKVSLKKNQAQTSCVNHSVSFTLYTSGPEPSNMLAAAGALLIVHLRKLTRHSMHPQSLLNFKD